MKRVLMAAVLVGAVLVAAGCAKSPYNLPIPAILPDGGRGFAMTGYVQFTADESKARAEVVGAFESACGGAVVLRRLDMRRADSLIGAPHLHYDAVAECADRGAGG